MKYRINEIFYSLQGEGVNTGRPAIFIRFAGCNLNCPFCDTNWCAFTEMTSTEICEKIKAIAPVLPDMVVLTGGEPTLQVTEKLTKKLHSLFKVIAIETNGTRPIPQGVDFVTLSPKDDFVASADCCVGKANEVKIVFNGLKSPEFWHTHIVAEHYYLQPCDIGDGIMNQQILAGTIDYIKKNPWWQLSLQTQKILKIR